MANPTCKSLGLMVALILFFLGVVGARHGAMTTIASSNKAIIKVVKGDHGEIIDCYDIYKQPTFDNLLFQNYKIQMKPSSYPRGLHSRDLETRNFTQSWQKYGTCPERTVPIIRSRDGYNGYNSSKPIVSPSPFSDKGHVHRRRNQDTTSAYELATISLQGGDFRGAQAKINFWKPMTEPGAYSASVVWITAGEEADEEDIAVGWQVNPDLYGDHEPRFFVFWSNETTSCYDLKCPGFVQTSSTITPGMTIDPNSISEFQGTQYANTFTIFQDNSTGNWWVKVQGVEVGYWPSFLFKQLSIKGSRVDFGGVISDAENRHNATEMGSGHLPSEGNVGVSSYFEQVQVFDRNHMARGLASVYLVQTNPNCYGLSIDHHQHLNGYGFFYGGPGLNYNCQ